MNYFDEATATLPRECLASLQPARLRAMAGELHSILSFRPRVRCVARNVLPRFEMKARRFHVRRA